MLVSDCFAVRKAGFLVQEDFHNQTPSAISLVSVIHFLLSSLTYQLNVLEYTLPWLDLRTITIMRIWEGFKLANISIPPAGSNTVSYVVDTLDTSLTWVLNWQQNVKIVYKVTSIEHSQHKVLNNTAVY